MRRAAGLSQGTLSTTSPVFEGSHNSSESSSQRAQAQDINLGDAHLVLSKSFRLVPSRPHPSCFPGVQLRGQKEALRAPGPQKGKISRNWPGPAAKAVKTIGLILGFSSAGPDRQF
jgi:hypothetical protein